MNYPEIDVNAFEQELIELRNLSSKSSTTRNILCYLDRGDFQSAHVVWQVDCDKIQQYPDIEQLLVKIFGCRLHFKHNCKECEWYHGHHSV